MAECKGSPPFNNDSIKDIFSQLQVEWVDEKNFEHPWKFWSHEWAKHGSCATTRHQLIPDQHAYFATSLELKRQFNFTRIFERNSIIPSNNTLYDTASTLNILKKDLGVEVRLHCEWKRGEDAILVDARVCIDSKLAPFDCPQEPRPTLWSDSPLGWTAPCPKQFIMTA
uniref:Ribonuclease T(2) n=1 Tax=Mesocestoides corti TaxID=53468 RepID=A0A5K3FXW1_MESCO